MHGVGYQTLGSPTHLFSDKALLFLRRVTSSGVIGAHRLALGCLLSRVKLVPVIRHLIFGEENTSEQDICFDSTSPNTIPHICNSVRVYNYIYTFYIDDIYESSVPIYIYVYIYIYISVCVPSFCVSYLVTSFLVVDVPQIILLLSPLLHYSPLTMIVRRWKINYPILDILIIYLSVSFLIGLLCYSL